MGTKRMPRFVPIRFCTDVRIAIAVYTACASFSARSAAASASITVPS